MPRGLSGSSSTPTRTIRSSAPGQYFWRYRFATKQGKLSNWSVTRSFTVTSNAVEFPMPTRAQQRERVPREHPRLLMRPEDLPRLRAAARAKSGGAAAEFAKLRAAAEQIAQSAADPGTDCARLQPRRRDARVLVAQPGANRESLPGSGNAGLRLT